MPLVWVSMVLPVSWELLVRFTRWKTQFPKLKKNQEKSRHCRQLRPLKKKKPVRLKNTSAEVIAFTGRKGNGNGGYQYPDINLLKRPKEKSV